MNLRLLLHTAAATTTAAAALAAPSSAPAQVLEDEIVECRVTFVVGPVMCRVENTQQQISDDPPVVNCSVSFVIGPVQCAAERLISDAAHPDNF